MKQFQQYLCPHNQLARTVSEVTIDLNVVVVTSAFFCWYSRFSVLSGRLWLIMDKTKERHYSRSLSHMNAKVVNKTMQQDCFPLELPAGTLLQKKSLQHLSIFVLPASFSSRFSIVEELLRVMAEWQWRIVQIILGSCKTSVQKKILLGLLWNHHNNLSH